MGHPVELEQCVFM